MENWIQKAVSQWKDEGLDLNPGATLADIADAEKQIGFLFPDDLKELYLVANGFVDFEWKSSMISLWSLKRIVDDHKTGKRFIMFGDFFTSTWQYGFDRNQPGIFKALSHHQQEPIQFIAESFQRTIELINCDSESLF